MIAERTVEIPAVLSHQLPVVESSARFKVVRAGRRGGKTVLAEHCAVVGHGPEDPVTLEPLFRGIAHDLDVVWVARDYTQAGIMWHEFIRPRFKGVDGVRVNEGDRTVTLIGAGTLFVISAENIASARGMGKRLAGMVVEEAAWLALKAALRDVILPALMDNEGWLLLISTTNAGPDGNQEKETPSYFNQICAEIRAGERSKEWEEFHFTALDNPKIAPGAFQSLVVEYPAGSPELRQEVYADLLVAGIGRALDKMCDKHLVEAFSPPQHWSNFGAFDWGFNHPYAFGWFVADEDGNVFLVDTIWGRNELPDQIAEKVQASVPLERLTYVAGGHDLKNDMKARGENGPTLKERFNRRTPPWKIVDANISRVTGLNNLRLYVEWTDEKPVPRFRMMDTEGNRRVLKCLERMQIDEKNVEDAQKVDADYAGNGGDDAYDMVRYGLMSRPLAALPQKAPAVKQEDRATPYDYTNKRFIKRFDPEEAVRDGGRRSFTRSINLPRYRGR